MNEELKWATAVDDHYAVVSEKVDHVGYTPWVTMLYGSQNYGLATPESDVDTKSMAIPSLTVLARAGRPLSTEYTMSDGSLDNCKDLREMFRNYLKGNINFVETLYTKHWSCNTNYLGHWSRLRSYRDLIANARPVKLMHMTQGMAKQKYAAFDHPFAGKAEVLAKYGYDPKQLHHQYRLLWFVETYLNSCNFEQALLCCHPQVNKTLYNRLMMLKEEPLNYPEAAKLREEFDQRIQELVATAPSKLPEDNGYSRAEAVLQRLAEDIIEASIKNDLST